MRGPPQRRAPPLRAHPGGGDGPANVWWWDHGQCRGSNLRHGVGPALRQRVQEGGDRAAHENRWEHGCQKSKGRGDTGRSEQMEWGRGVDIGRREQMEWGVSDARGVHVRCNGAQRRCVEDPLGLPLTAPS